MCNVHSNAVVAAWHATAAAIEQTNYLSKAKRTNSIHATTLRTPPLSNVRYAAHVARRLSGHACMPQAATPCKTYNTDTMPQQRLRTYAPSERQLCIETAAVAMAVRNQCSQLKIRADEPHVGMPRGDVLRQPVATCPAGIRLGSTMHVTQASASRASHNRMRVIVQYDAMSTRTQLLIKKFLVQGRCR